MKYTSDPAGGDAAAAPQPAAYQPPAPQQPGNGPVVEVEDTPDDQITPGDPLHARARAAAAHTTATWLGLLRQPPSISDAWDMSSSMNRQRVPGQSGLLAAIWWGANYSERLFLFAVTLLLLAPAATLLWVVARPSRRFGLYGVLLLVVAVAHIAGG
jgi:hypothetical protein